MTVPARMRLSHSEGRCGVTICRGCCCGTVRKHPDVDHDRQVRTLRDQLDGMATVRTADCLDACDKSNVMVLQPSRTGCAAGGRPVWLGRILNEDTLHHIATWIGDGGPGIAPLPGSLTAHVIPRPAQTADDATSTAGP